MEIIKVIEPPKMTVKAQNIIEIQIKSRALSLPIHKLELLIKQGTGFPTQPTMDIQILGQKRRTVFIKNKIKRFEFVRENNNLFTVDLGWILRKYGTKLTRIIPSQVQSLLQHYITHGFVELRGLEIFGCLPLTESMLDALIALGWGHKLGSPKAIDWRAIIWQLVTKAEIRTAADSSVWSFIYRSDGAASGASLPLQDLLQPWFKQFVEVRGLEISGRLPITPRLIDAIKGLRNTRASSVPHNPQRSSWLQALVGAIRAILRPKIDWEAILQLVTKVEITTAPRIVSLTFHIKV